MNPVSGWEGAAIGSVEPRGERGLLAVPVDTLMRLRSNPFFSYVEQRVLEFIGCQPKSTSGSTADMGNAAGASAERRPESAVDAH